LAESLYKYDTIPHVLFEICFPLAGKGKKEEGRKEGRDEERRASWERLVLAFISFPFSFSRVSSCFFLPLFLPPSPLSYVNSPFPPCRVSLFWVLVALLRKGRHLPYSSP